MRAAEFVSEGWKGTALGSILGWYAGHKAGSPILGTMLGTWLGAWLTKDKSPHSEGPKMYRVYINGKLQSINLLNKKEAVQSIISAAEKEHDRKTQYTIANAYTEKIVFRRYWDDSSDENLGYEGDPGWRDIDHDDDFTPPAYLHAPSGATPRDARSKEKIEPTLNELSEEWSEKYKKSINCSNPRGFSQKAHCAGRKKNEDLNEFAPGSDDGNNDPEDVLLRFAKLWYSAPDVATQRRVEQALAKIGWEIGELESEDGGAFVMRVGDETGDSYLAWSEEQLAQLNELSFLGSQCTKDCSGHRAGYEWSTRKGGADAASWSPSFNKGAWLHNNGF